MVPSAVYVRTICRLSTRSMMMASSPSSVVRCTVSLSSSRIRCSTGTEASRRGAYSDVLPATAHTRAVIDYRTGGLTEWRVQPVSSRVSRQRCRCPQRSGCSATQPGRRLPVPVAAFRLVEDHRVVVGDGGLDHDVGVGGVRAGGDPQSDGLAEKYALFDSLWCSTPPMPPPTGMRMVTGSLSRPPDRACILASWLTIWSNAGYTNPAN